MYPVYGGQNEDEDEDNSSAAGSDDARVFGGVGICG